MNRKLLCFWLFAFTAVAVLFSPTMATAIGQHDVLVGAPGMGVIIAQQTPVADASATSDKTPAKEEKASEAPKSSQEAGAKEEEPSTIEQIGDQARETYNLWKTIGWVAGLGGLVMLLILLLRYPAIDALFVKYEIKWIKAFIASVLGGISAGIAAYQLDQDIVASIIAGMVIIGPAAIGFFEQLSKFSKKNRDSGKT